MEEEDGGRMKMMKGRGKTELEEVVVQVVDR